VGSFVAATPARAIPAREHDRRVRAFVTRLLADAAAVGITVHQLIAALKAHQEGEE
jgi:hypothetical protein